MQPSRRSLASTPGASAHEDGDGAPTSSGGAQRARLGARLGALPWWTALGGLVCAALFTALAARHTDAATVAAAQSQDAAALPGAPSQSLFLAQPSDDGGGFFGAATSVGRSSFRSRTS